jgi:hypothetical protein
LKLRKEENLEPISTILYQLNYKKPVLYVGKGINTIGSIQKKNFGMVFFDA